MAFNPDNFLSETEPPSSSSFDPDNFLSETDLNHKPDNMASSFIHGVVNNFPLGPQIAAGSDTLAGKIGLKEPKSYSQNLEELNQTFKASKKQNPISYGAGAVGGNLAPLAVPGVGAALESSPWIGNAALGAAGAISNKDLSKEPIKTATDAGMGALLGMGAYGAVNGAVKGVSNLAKNIISKNITGSLEANATSDALHLGTYGLRKLSKALKENPETVLNDINAKINEHIPDLIKLNDTASSKLQKLIGANEQASNVIGKVIDTADQTLKGADSSLQSITDEAIEELTSHASKYNKLTSARNSDARAELLDAAQTLKELKDSGGLNFRNLYEVKKGIGEAYHNEAVDNPGIDKAYSVISDKINKLVDKVTVDNPALKTEYAKAKDLFMLTSELIPAMKRGVIRDVAGTSGSLSNAALGAGAIFGHPIAAAGAYAGKTASKLAMPDLGKNIAYKTINTLKNAAVPNIPAGQMMTQELINFLTSKYGDKKQ